MWQAQIIGRKTWKLVPPPECDHVCNRMSVTVEAGDIGEYAQYILYLDLHAFPFNTNSVAITIGLMPLGTFRAVIAATNS